MSIAPQFVAALNGRIIPAREARLSIIDDAIVQGATLIERLRTFQHQPYLQSEHLDRLRAALQQTHIAPSQTADALPKMIDQVVCHNARLIAKWQDLAIVIFISPGENRAMGMPGSGRTDEGPTVCVHTVALPSPQWAEQSRDGVRLVTPEVRHVDATSIDPRLKHRSRLHWFLADQEARRIDPHSAALLLDHDGHVTETATGNLVIHDGKRLLTPRAEQVLGGLSRQVVSELAAAIDIPTVATNLTPADVINAREAFLTSTGYCLLPVTRLNGRAIGDGRPGPLSARLLADWSARVGVDILAQHQRAASKSTT